MEHLWVHRPAPWKYVELVLCRDVYHCTPVELDQVPLVTILEHLAMMRVESIVHDMEGNKYERITKDRKNG